jgi:hypothetical protein
LTTPVPDCTSSALSSTDAVAQIIVIFARTHVEKRQHRDRPGATARHPRPEGRRVCAQRFQHHGQFRGGPHALAGVLLETSHRDALQLRRHRGHRRRPVVEDGGQRFARRITPEGRVTREHFVQHRANGENVGALVHRAGLDLLGGHVAGRANQHAGRRNRQSVGRLAVDANGAQLRQPEVQNLEVAVGGDKEILGFDVAMNHAQRVRGGNAAGHLQRQRSGAAGVHRAGGQRVPQGLSFQQFGNDERAAVVRAHVEQRYDVGMREQRGGARRGRDTPRPYRRHRAGRRCGSGRIAFRVRWA